MIPASIQTELGKWLWTIRPSHVIVRQGDDIIDEAEATGPTATVDPAPILEGPWWGDRPWFADNGLSSGQLGYLEEAGYPRPIAQNAADALRRLFPRDVCTTLALDHETRMLIAPLYQTFVPFVTPLLALGCDLIEAHLWDDEHLIKRLIIPSEHWGAATEVSVAAALRRAGLRPEREPRGREAKRPEYVVQLDFWRYFIEVKTNPDSVAEKRAERLQRGLLWLHEDLAHEGHNLVVTGSEKLQCLLADARVPLPDSLASDLRRDLRRYLDQGKSANLTPGRHTVGDYLLVDVEPADPGSSGRAVSLISMTDQKIAHRIIRKLRDAAKQMPQAARGVAVVDIGSARNLVALLEAIGGAFSNAPKVFEPIRAIVFHLGDPTPTGHRQRRIFGAPAPGARLDPAEQKIVRSLLLPRVNEKQTLEEILYGANDSVLVEFKRSNTVRA